MKYQILKLSISCLAIALFTACGGGQGSITIGESTGDTSASSPDASTTTTTTPTTNSPVVTDDIFIFTSTSTPQLSVPAGSSASATVLSNERFQIVSSSGTVGTATDIVVPGSGACTTLNPTVGTGYSVIYVGTCTRKISFAKGFGSSTTTFTVIVQ